MQFEIIRKSHKKEMVIGISLFVILGVVLIARFTFAKYSLVKSVKMAEGTINYKVPDFKMMAMYKNDGAGDTEISTMPGSDYVINETKSYCTLDNINKDTKAKLYTDENGNHIISGLSKYDKCYLYFDNYKKVNTALGEITVKLATPDYSKTSCSRGCGEATVGIYQAKDDDGWSYYYRGDVENNYVKFANKWWRIIRINGDGSIRLIYDGTEAHVNGTSTSDSIAISGQSFNASYNNNMYVGYKYKENEVHGLGTKSNALTQLETWYSNNLASHASKIDTNTGFCGDRTPYTDNKGTTSGGGTGTTTTYYGAYIRFLTGTDWRTTQTPTFKCKNRSDIYTISASNKGNKSLTYPIGLITADEVVYAGGFGGKDNTSYYLYNGQHYWTLSPWDFSSGYARGFYVHTNGHLRAGNLHTTEIGLRPTINLRSDVKITGNGTITNPYIVS